MRKFVLLFGQCRIQKVPAVKSSHTPSERFNMQDMGNNNYWQTVDLINNVCDVIIKQVWKVFSTTVCRGVRPTLLLHLLAQTQKNFIINTLY